MHNQNKGEKDVDMQPKAQIAILTLVYTAILIFLFKQLAPAAPDLLPGLWALLGFILACITNRFLKFRAKNALKKTNNDE